MALIRSRKTEVSKKKGLSCLRHPRFCLYLLEGKHFFWERESCVRFAWQCRTNSQQSLSFSLSLINSLLGTKHYYLIKSTESSAVVCSCIQSCLNCQGMHLN